MVEVANKEMDSQPASADSAIEQRPGRGIRSAVFRYYIHDSADTCRLQLLGELSEADVAELAGCWQTARTTLGSRKLVLDLRDLKGVDEAGKQWLAGMAQENASYIPESFLRDALAGKPSQTPVAPGKVSLLGRVCGLLRGVDVAQAD